MNIAEIIPIGKENAIHQEQLANILGVSRSTAKELVREARKNGEEILSGSCGYYYAKDDEERKEFVNSLSKQAYTRLKTTRPIKHSLNVIKGQMSIDDPNERERKKGGGSGE